jgi:RNA-binding protein Musashi
VSQECTEQYFKEFFMKFGRVIDATLMMDKDTGRPRGFGFVTFDGEDAVDRTLSQPLAIHGKQIEVKRAEPRGNVHDEKGGGKFGKRGRGGDQQGQFDGSGQDQFQGGPQGGQGTNGMSQAQMAAYWFKMQEYFRNMQNMMSRNMAMQAQGPMPGMMGGMNPAMMQQMMMAQRQGMMSPNAQQMAGPNGGPLSPDSMQQMMQQAGGGQQGGGNGDFNGGGGHGGRGGPNFNSQEQMAFEQQKYEKQQMARMQQSQYQSQQGGGYGLTSWEGMYDDVPPPNMAPAGPSGGQGGGRGGYGGRGRRGGGSKHGSDGGGSHQGGNAPANAPSAPANAPTGPRNAGRPGANYRGGGRGGNHNRPFRPY